MLNQQQKNPSFGLRKYVEAPLNFAPTFKYDRGTDHFDTSEKLRIPAYCDRILYRGKKVTQHSYNRLELRMSDHRPVYAEFTILVQRIDPAKYEIYEQAASERIYSEKQQSIRNASLSWLMDTFDQTFEQAQQHLDRNGGRIC